MKLRVGTVLRRFFGPVYHCFYNRPKALDNVSCEHYLSIAACVKDEGRYLREWIEYHLWAGVEHFYLYDNGSTDNTRDVLDPYVQRGIVTYHYYVEERKRYNRKRQMLMYGDAVTRYRYCTKWMAIIDADEFIALTEEGKRQFGTGGGLVNFFKQREQCVGIGINWLCFDGGGHETMPKSGYVVENYTRAYKGQSAYRTCGFKSVVQPRQVTCAGVHHCEYRLLKKAANERARPLQMAWDYSFDTKSRSAELIQINHYYTKSKEEYLEKINVRKYGWKSESQQKTYNETDWAFPEWEADDSMKEAAAALRAKGVPETYSANSF